MFNDDEVPNLHCGDCKYFKVGAELEGVISTCKRIDHKIIRFAVPWFKSYDCGQYSGCICCDFLPNPAYKYVYNNWTNFDEYWKQYVKIWLPYSNVNVLKGFTLNGDTSIRYKVKLLDFVYDTMIQGDTLRAVEKEYYKRCKKTKENPIGYKLIHEPINGVLIKGGEIK